MAEEWQVLSNVADNLTVVSCLVIFVYTIVSGKLNTAKHTEDVVKGKDELNVELRAERDRAVQRDEASRRELAENNAVLGRLEVTVREALASLARRR